MSKAAKKPGVNRLVVLYGAFAILTLIILVPVLLLIRYRLNENSSKAYLITAFSKIALPSYLEPVSQSYAEGGIDNSSNWYYSFRTSADRAVAFKDILATLKSSGYTITQSEDQYEDAIAAEDFNDQTSVSVALGPSANAGQPTSLRTVDFRIERAL